MASAGADVACEHDIPREGPGRCAAASQLRVCSPIPAKCVLDAVPLGSANICTSKTMPSSLHTRLEIRRAASSMRLSLQPADGHVNMGCAVSDRARHGTARAPARRASSSDFIRNAFVDDGSGTGAPRRTGLLGTVDRAGGFIVTVYLHSFITTHTNCTSDGAHQSSSGGCESQFVHTCSNPCVFPVMMSPRSCRARGRGAVKQARTEHTTEHAAIIGARQGPPRYSRAP
eukprot:scaffold116532_cov75-Phaeocystis_antarctica.AAC.1